MTQKHTDKESLRQNIEVHPNVENKESTKHLLHPPIYKSQSTNVLSTTVQSKGSPRHSRLGSALPANSTSPNLNSQKKDDGVLQEKAEENVFSFSTNSSNQVSPARGLSTKKKRSSSWLNMISPTVKQKNEFFHRIFKDLPAEEILLLDYSCALVKDILVQGKMYISQNFICFHSNILKWQTVMIIDFKDIDLIKKEKTARFIPNAIGINVKEKTSTFTSFTQRKRAYDQLIKLWHNSKKEQPVSGQELWEKSRSYGNFDAVISSDDEILDSEFVNQPSKTEKSGSKSSESNECHSRAVSIEELSLTDEGAINESEESAQDEDSSCDDKSVCPSDALDRDLNNQEFTPVKHAQDLGHVYLEKEFAFSAEALLDTLFGETNSFREEFLISQKGFNIVIESWRDGEGKHQGEQVRKLNYTLILTNPLAPKTSKVEETQVLCKESDPGKCYAVDCYAQNIDVPYAEYFVSAIRYSIRNTSKTSCELRITAKVQYHKSPWALVKTFIEKNWHGGMIDGFQQLENELGKYLLRNPPNHLPISMQRTKKSTKKKEKRKRKKARSEEDQKIIEHNKSEQINAPVENFIVTSKANEAKDDTINNYKQMQSYARIASKYQIRNKQRKIFEYAFIFMSVILLLNNYLMHERVRILEQTLSSLEEKALPIRFLDSFQSGKDSDFCNRKFSSSTSNIICDIIYRANRVESVLREYVDTMPGRLDGVLQEWNYLKYSITSFAKEYCENFKESNYSGCKLNT